MRKLLYIVLLAVLCFGCEPHVKYLNVQPSSVAAGPASVTVNWRISVGNGEMSADQAVTPSLNPPKQVNTEGSMVEQVCKTTTFKLSLPYGGERTATVTVAKPCGQGGEGCNNQILTFTGTCISSSQGPNYISLNLGAALAPGNLKDLQSDANFPVHVFHLGQEIGLGAGGGPIFPLPVIPAAGDYTITIPGVPGQQACAGAGPTMGSTDAPVIHITVVPTCPTP